MDRSFLGELLSSRAASSIRSTELFSLRKACLIVSMGRDYSIFIIDLAAADGDESEGYLTVDDDKFVLTRPNLRFVRGGSSYFCVSATTLYIFYVQNPKTPPQIYSYELCRADSFSDVLLEEKMMYKEKIALSFKSAPQAVHYRSPTGEGKILWFSSLIRFSDIIGAEATPDEIDFEMYDPQRHTCKVLPRLRIRRTFDTDRRPSFELFQPLSSPNWKEFSVSSDLDDEDLFDFFIVSFAFADSRFLVETSFGRVFGLALEYPDQWIVCENGLQFTSENLNVLTPNGLCMGPFGVKVLKSQLDERLVPLPISDIGGSLVPGGGSHSALLALLGDYPHDIHTPIVVQLAFDSRSEDSSSKLYWIVDVLRVSWKDFPVENDKEACDKFVKCIKSFKFCLKNEFVFLSHIVGLFPFKVSC